MLASLLSLANFQPRLQLILVVDVTVLFKVCQDSLSISKALKRAVLFHRHTNSKKSMSNVDDCNGQHLLPFKKPGFLAQQF